VIVKVTAPRVALAKVLGQFSHLDFRQGRFLKSPSIASGRGVVAKICTESLGARILITVLQFFWWVARIGPFGMGWGAVLGELESWAAVVFLVWETDARCKKRIGLVCS
jgi:hypothetical protein